MAKECSKNMFKFNKKIGVLLSVIIAVIIFCFIYFTPYETYYMINGQKISQTEPAPEILSQPRMFGTTLSSKTPVAVTLRNCEGEQYDAKTCFGMGAELYKTEDSLELWSRISTDTLANFGIALSDKDKYTFYSVAVDFGNHAYTEKEYDESVDLVKEILTSNIKGQ